jgi:NAD(P)-dependent dehydrogenase (short-subunit alcohol dehydrogenase family)
MMAPQLFRLDQRIFLLTGATGHLGKALAQGLCEAGAHLIINARSQANLENLAARLKKQGHQISLAPFDISDEAACRKAISSIGSRLGALDGIINNAYGGSPGTLEAAQVKDFELSCRQNIIAPFVLMHQALPLLKEAGQRHPDGAAVVNIASMYGMVSPDPRIYGDSGSNNPPFYGVGKAGMIQLTRYLACHLAEWNIRVNSVSPGPFPPPTIEPEKPELYAHLCNKTPLHRIGRSRELVGPVIFLLSPAASYVTGVNLPVDGGWTAW